MANLTKNLIFRPFHLDQVVREGEVDKIGELGFYIFLVPMHISIREKSFFSSETSGATKRVGGFVRRD